MFHKVKISLLKVLGGTSSSEIQNFARWKFVCSTELNVDLAVSEVFWSLEKMLCKDSKNKNIWFS